jgi:predicted site-specific integrase-resolvase
MGLGNEDPTIGYARVSSHDQKNDLVRKQELLEAFCAAKGWRHEVIVDLGSGLNCRKKGLNHLLELILCKRIRRLVPTHKDRLLRARAVMDGGFFPVTPSA